VLLDPKVRTSQDAIRATGGAPVIGAIPRLWIASTSNGIGRRGLLAGAVRGRLVESGTRGQLVTFDDPTSPAAEAYRGLRARLALLGSGEAPRVIVTTSPMPGEGKSVTAANLAIALAQQGIRTLLVDADLRQGSVHRLLGVERTPGLAELLLGTTETEAAVRELASGRPPLPLAVLPCGGSAPNPAELLGSASMRQFLDAARSHYEVIVMDAPPLHAAADAVVLGALADRVLLVARAGTTNKRALADAAAELHRLGIPLEGLVVNELDDYEAPYTRYAAADRAAKE
jgi:tyrosine-protein kinase Etk/Wzc